MRGKSFLYPPTATALVRDYLDDTTRGGSTPEDLLTARELEVVKLIAEGHSSEEIADELVLSKKTVERHRANVMGKLGNVQPRGPDSLCHPAGPLRALASTGFRRPRCR